MTINFVQETAVKRPTPDPLGSTVLDHATVNTVSGGFGWRNEEGLWPSYNMIDTLVPTPMCPDPLDGFKTFETAPWVPAFSFAVKGGVQCKAVGLDTADQEAEVSRVFERNEGSAVEEALLANRFRESSSDSDVIWDAPVDLTPGGPATLLVALALLEGYAAATYAGVPTIHMPRAAASVLSDRLRWEGGKAYTLLGSKVAIGGGYDPTDPTAAWDLYATGEVYVEKSETVEVAAWVIPGDGSGTGNDQNGLADNTRIALAERMFRVAVDGFVAKATGLVPVPASGGGGGGAGLVDNGDGTWSVA